MEVTQVYERIPSLGFVPVDPFADRKFQTVKGTTRTFQGFYTVNADGTGTLTLNYAALPSDQNGVDDNGAPVYSQANLTARYDFVVVNNKAEFRGIRADNGLYVSAAFSRQ